MDNLECWICWIMFSIQSFRSLNRVAREWESHVDQKWGKSIHLSQKLCLHFLLKLLYQRPDFYIWYFLHPSSNSKDTGWVQLSLGSSWGILPSKLREWLVIVQDCPLQCFQLLLIWECVLMYQEEMAREIKFWMRESMESVPWATGSIDAGVRASTNVPPRGVVSISLMVFPTLSERDQGSCLLPHFRKYFFRSKHICCEASGWGQAELLQIFCCLHGLPSLPAPASESVVHPLSLSPLAFITYY